MKNKNENNNNNAYYAFIDLRGFYYNLVNFLTVEETRSKVKLDFLKW